jgi:hypothetical protein
MRQKKSLAFRLLAAGAVVLRILAYDSAAPAGKCRALPQREIRIYT